MASGFAAIGRILTFAVAIGLAPCARAQSVTPVAVAAHLETSGQITRLSFDLTRAAAARAFVLADPDRVVIDLPEVNFQIDAAPARHPPGRHPQAKLPPAPAGAGLIRAYRFGLLGPGRSRVVIDLSGPARVARLSSASIAGGDPARLTLELAPTDRASFLSAAAEAPAPPPAQDRQPAPALGRPVVVLDPGHGGVDSGAANGAAVEKAIVFEFALALAAKLDASGRYAVVLTRRGDEFVSLGDRVRFAHDNHAALFVSLHADTLSDGAEVQGATFYTAAEKASDGEAARLAEKENRADIAAGLDGAEETTGVTDILADLTRRETRAYSHLFARTLAGLWQTAGKLNKNPERSAGFRVLKASDVPSVLIELGYLSSAKDIANLTSEAWREKAAGAAAAAVDRFFENRSLNGLAAGGAAVAQTRHTSGISANAAPMGRAATETP